MTDNIHRITFDNHFVCFFSELELSNGYKLRRAAIDFNVPLFTNARLATAFIRAFTSMSPDDIQIKAWDEY